MHFIDLYDLYRMTTSSQECSPAVSPVPQIRSFPHRIIRPLADKEAIQRNFVTLPNRAANFSRTFFDDYF